MASDTPVVAAGNATAHFPWIQTRLAVERTLLAWVRTAAAMITFGFGIFHLFEELNASPGVHPPWRPGSAKLLGVSLVGIGTLALVLALVQYLALVRYLGVPSFVESARIPRFHPSLVVALILTMVGIATFWALFVRLPS
jgi:putative membrane protein